jgi:predicted nucleic-acid-binding protein
MTGLDTNVLARFFAQDDPDQSRHVDQVLQSLTPEAPGFVSLVSLTELVWLLCGSYGVSKPQLIECVKQLLNSPEVVLEGQTAVTQALHRFAKAKVDFVDCLIERCGHVAGCKETVTFDVKASRSGGMRLL